MFPRGNGSGKRGSGIKHSKLKGWHKPLEEFTLQPGDFTIGLTKKQLAYALHLFKTKQCGYIDVDDETISCFASAKRGEREYERYSKQFHHLLRRIDKWTISDKKELFYLAYVNRGAAMIGKPRFMRYSLNKIRESMRYLLLVKEGNPLVRFEHVVKGNYKLPGMSISGISFLMHLWKPKEYAIWNGSVDKGLRKLKISFPRPFSSHVAQGYQDCIAALQQMMRLTNLRSFKLIDHFVDAFGKGHLTLGRMRRQN
jgi:hypothetical protein